MTNSKSAIIMLIIWNKTNYLAVFERKEHFLVATFKRVFSEHARQRMTYISLYNIQHFSARSSPTMWYYSCQHLNENLQFNVDPLFNDNIWIPKFEILSHFPNWSSSSETAIVHWAREERLVGTEHILCQSVGSTERTNPAEKWPIWRPKMNYFWVFGAYLDSQDIILIMNIQWNPGKL